MTSNREARILGLVDRIHYKYYAYMSNEQYLKEVKGVDVIIEDNNQKVVEFRNNNMKIVDYIEKDLTKIFTSIRIASENDNELKVNALANELKIVSEQQLKQLISLKYELVGASSGLNQEIKRYVDVMLEYFELLIDYRKAILEDDLVKAVELGNDTIKKLDSILEMERNTFEMFER